MSHPLQATIEDLWERRTELSPDSPPTTIAAINSVIGELDTGKLRVAEKITGEWITHQWIKKAVLLSFRVRDNRLQIAGDLRFFDKVDSKFENWTREQFRQGGFRVVPPAVARKGSYIARNAVLMPSYVNIGAYVDENTMVDTWVTVGSCAQIGKNVHLSGGVGIGGVLEPLQANPTIIEYGRVPPGSVVVSGNLPSADGKYSLYCAVIVKKVDAQTRAKTSINELLRA